MPKTCLIIENELGTIEPYLNAISKVMDLLTPTTTDLKSMIRELPTLLRRSTPDVILLDLMFPEHTQSGNKKANMGGEIFLRMLRSGQIENLPHNTPVVILSGFRGIKDFEEAHRDHVDAVFCKPSAVKNVVRAIIDAADKRTSKDK